MLQSYFRLTCAAAVFGVLASTPPALAQEQRITLAQGRAIAAQLLRTGEPLAAREIANGLLQANPDDFTALLILTETAIVLRDYPAAVQSGARAYDASTGGSDSYTAARLVALAHAEQLNDTRAQFWLRRAREYAPTAEDSESVAKDFRFLRNRNPLSYGLRFGLTPSSNVNGGSAGTATVLNDRVRLLNEILFNRDIETPLELSSESEALSGIEASAQVNVTYRLRATDLSATFFEASGNWRSYVLSDEAQTLAPNAKGSDYSDASLRFGITHRWIGAPGAEPTEVSLSVAKTWYGEDPYTESVYLSGGQSWIVGPSDRLRLSMATQRLQLTESGDLSNLYSITGGWTHLFGGGDKVQLDATLTRNVAVANDSDYAGIRLAADYAFAEPFNGIAFSFGFALEERRYDATNFGDGSRLDQGWNLNARAVLTEMEYFGFQPVITISGGKTDSNTPRFVKEDFQLGFDLQSSF